ncbi:response regulator [Undibacterium sp. CY18W]|uniref:histidine kinase n=1 Tax=Undibacterium hunanense TaxID=2762292 RepID=A0ABR6ZP55_9BURK|nr:response regulator [Undibacterium hunanense]MBC3917677.1 response regulator [Undibacterium hunanense]
MSAQQDPPLTVNSLIQASLLYFVLAVAGMLLSRSADNVAILWYANAVAVAYLCDQPLRRNVPLLLFFAAANFAANMLLGNGLLLSGLFTVANIIEILLVTYTLRSADLVKDFDIAGSKLTKLILLGFFLPCACSATIGAAMASWAGLGNFSHIFPTWYVGATLGMALIFPMMRMAMRHTESTSIQWLRVIRYALPTVAMVFVALTFLPFPFVYVLVALTFGIQKLSYEESHLLIVLAITSLGLMISLGHFMSPDIESNWQIFLMYLPVLITTIPPMLLSASLNEGRIKEAERLQFAVELSNSQAALQTVIDHMQAMIGYWDIDLKNRFANGAYKKWFGFDAHAMQGLHLRVVIGEEGFQQSWFHIQAALLGEAQLFERTIIDTEGEKKHALISYIPHALDGVVHGFYSFVTDITQLRQAQMQEILARAKLTSMFEAASEFAIIATDTVGNIQIFSKGAERLLGYKADEVINRQPVIEIHLREEVRQRAQALSVEMAYHVSGFEVFVAKARTGQSEVQQWTYVTKQGQHIPVSLVVSAIRNDKNEIEGFLGIATDISRQKQLEASLIAAKEQAEMASRAKSEFLANMSHEIRTPMNAVLGMSYLLNKTELSTVQRNYLNMIRSSGQSLLSILNDILDISKIEAGRIELSPTRFFLKDVLSALANMMSVNVGEKNLELSLGIDAGVPGEMIGDALRLQQILINIIGNAIKFTESGEVSLLVQKQEQPETADSAALLIQFIVRDTGIGMSAEQISRLFTAFEQADASTSRRFGGTGLGLAISRRFVELMDGSIDVSSIEGQGTEFRVSIPMLPVTSDKDTLAGTQLMSGAETDQGSLQHIRKILVVDDNITSRTYIAKTIQAWGWQADVAASGAEAIQKVQALGNTDAAYNAILIDWHMPVQDGLETVQVLDELLAQARLPQIPLILMSSAYDRSALVLENTRRKPDAILLKPVTGSSLYDILQETSAHAHGAGRIRPMPVADQGSFAGARILLVEDNKFNQIVATGILEQAGISIEIANNGSEAVELLKTSADRFDLVLMDVQMPIMDGWTATEVLRKEYALQLPILAMTAGVMQAERERCLGVGMNDLIFKPIDVEQMMAALARHLPRSAASVSSRPVLPVQQIGAPADTGQDIFDPAKLLSLAKGNPAIIKTLVAAIENMTSVAQVEFGKADECWREGNAVQAGRILHTLRGSIGTLGANDFAQSALSLENAINSNQQDLAETLFIVAKTKLDQVVAMVNDWLKTQHQDDNTEQAATTKTQPDRLKLDELKTLLAAQNMRASELHQILHTDLSSWLSRDRSQKLDSAMAQLDFQAALDVLQQQEL